MDSTFKMEDFDNLLSDLQASLQPLAKNNNDAGSAATPTTTTTQLPTPQDSTPTIQPQNTPISQPPKQPDDVKAPVGRGRTRTGSRTVSSRRESVLVKPDPVVLQKAQKLICAKCYQPISGVYITALDKVWHQEHFTCNYCNSPMQGTFFETDTGIMCESCALSIFKCSECGQAITGPHLVFEDGRTIHPHCIPKKPCARCHQLIPLNEAHVEALDQYWHPEHFTCTRCHSKLPAQFIQLKNNPYCMDCINAIQKEKNIVINIQ